MSFLQKTMKGAKIGHFKNTENCPSAAMPIPQEVCISMSQHMGPPCKPVVAKGDTVKVGTLIGDSDAFLSAPVHSSVSGTVKSIEEIVTNMGARTQVVIIESDGEQTVDENVKPPVIENHADFVKAIRASGLVGLGGAGFPSHIKLNPKNLSEVDTLVVNAAECEPYITSDYRTIMERADDVMAGIAAIKKYVGITQVKIAVENNKPQAIEMLRRMTADDPSIEVASLRSIYPKGAEKVAIFETTGRVVKEGQLPSDAGVIVHNITSTAFIGQYLRTGMPLVTKCLTVDGGAIMEAKNVIAPIGAHFADVVAFCGGYKGTPKKMLMGGPMMGIAIFDDAYPVLKNNNALLVFDESQTVVEPEHPCIRCGRCVQACPYHLMPRQIELAYERDDLDMLNKLKVMLCMECGSCSYVCPAKRGLTFSNKMAKQKLRAAAKK
ncbi:MULTISPECIES: electron transport complex subunit RsxC [Anaerotruncus]|jgi:electron transport complex protein RnfC|uniref:electron transport complex subunit RsxC n=1 Tax=Anaerotruncus TaxID=244127 RepID=UPI00082B9BB5|nr:MULTISPECIES: electron transport complex subunit RsxC [Anaerotruncus]RGX56459.1 electron transport complex subunit RsxC [Anaerotruncus sp. AF02-27]